MVQHRRTTGGGGWYPRITDGDKPQLQEAARKLLTNSKRTTERTILTEIIHLLKLLEIDEIESETTVSVGRLDIFCYRLRTIIETKKVGKAQVEVRSQLEPYIHAKIREDSNERPFETPEEQNRPWTGIITDGQTWHVWKYPNTLLSSPSEQIGPYNATTPEGLLKFLTREIFADKPLGKPRVPQNPYNLFEEHLDALNNIYTGLRGRSQTETKTKFSLWRDMLRASGMEPESESEARSLFVKHSFLVSIARNVAHILTSSEPEKDPYRILGDGFVSWIVQDPDGEDWQKDLLAKIHSYDWRRQKGDVLRSVYEGFISRKDRKIFGEHYTPDWLAELLVNETLDPDWLETSIEAAEAENSEKPLAGVGVLDPACGSGTFLYHAARKILESDAMQSLHLPPVQQAKIVVRLVNGIDVHPIAAEISRATLLRALPAPPPNGVKSINVWQGDSLMIFQSQEGEDQELLKRINERNLILQIPSDSQNQAREISIPLSFCESPNFNFEMDQLISYAKQNKIPKNFLAKISNLQDRETLRTCYQDFTKIIQERGNSVWAWYVTNITAPAFLSRRKINRIVANPPWVKMANIKTPYRKRELEKTFEEENLWTGGELASHNDIAQLFVKICRNTYLASPEENPASWIVKKSALKSGQWEKFREWHKSIAAQILDLEDPKPFGGTGKAKVPCVFLEYQVQPQTLALQNLAGEKLVIARNKIRSKKPAYNMNLREATELLNFEKAPPGIKKKESCYAGVHWRNGATMFPHVLLLIDQVKPSPESKNDIEIITKASRHLPWKTVGCKTGAIPKEWCRPICGASDLYPYMISPNPTTAIVPIDLEGNLALNPESNPFWNKLNKIYKKYRSKNSRSTLIEQINYQNVLVSQLEILQTDTKTTVIYPKSGDIMRSARTFPGKIIVENANYRQNFDSPEEAAYLVSLLNSPCLIEAFAEGRKSDRDFHTHVWECVPIPRFDSKIQDHIQLVKLCEEAEAVVQAWYDSDPKHATYSQIQASRQIRELLKENGISNRIDAIARKMLPDQAT